MDSKCLAVAAVLLAGAAPLHAASQVELAHSVFVEREVAADDGRTARVLEPARALRRGDRLVYVVAWRAEGSDRFIITNPLPRSVAYQRSADGLEQVSTDGGRTWGQLADLRVREDGSWRNASAEDVTHVRWQVTRQVAVAGSGRLTFSGIVR